MKLVSFTKYSKSGASSRYRFFQYQNIFEGNGLVFDVHPFFNDKYLLHKYNKGYNRFIHIISAFIRRAFFILTISAGSIVYIEYELVPFFPSFFERWLLWRGCKIILDYDDALFHQYKSHPNSIIRYFLGHKIDTVMRLSHIVVTGNRYLFQYAQRAGANRVELIPTVIDVRRYKLKQHLAESKNSVDSFIIGWIGSPTTAPYLQTIAPALAEICQNGNTILRLVGSGPIEIPGVPVEVIQWSEETEVNEICNFDVGIMPLPDDPWTRGKCGLKLIQYMGCAIPIIASPIGVNSEILSDGFNGYSATTNEQWVIALRNLQISKKARSLMGLNGRMRVEEHYCLHVTSSHWLRLLNSLNSDNNNI